MTTEKDQVRHDVAGWLVTYRPKMIDARSWIDDGLHAFVRAQIVRLDPAGVAHAKKCALQLAKLAAWGLQEGIELDVEELLHPDTVERYCETNLADDPHAGDYRAMLRHLGMRLTVHAPWEPVPAPMKTRSIAAPYDHETVKAFIRDAARQSTPMRAQTFQAMLALGLGAGLDGRWIHKIRGGDIDVVDGVTLIEVPSPCPRVVPVRTNWEHTIRELAAHAGDELLVGGDRPTPNLLNRRLGTLELGKDIPRPNAGRLRSTWLTAHLTAGTPLRDLAAAAGMSGITSLSDLLVHVPALSEAQARTRLSAI